MKINDFLTGKQSKRIELAGLLQSHGIGDKLKSRLVELNENRCEDEMLYFCSEREEWDIGMGTDGYVLVRDGEIIDCVVVRMN